MSDFPQTMSWASRFWAVLAKVEACCDRLVHNTHYQKIEEKCLARMMARFRGKDVLDVGCGHGKYMQMLEEKGCRVTGVDINPEQVASLCKAGQRAFTPEALPTDVRYDLILMAHVIEHMETEDLVAFMDRYLPLLKTDGKLIIVTPMPGDRFYYDFTHVRPYLPQSIRMMFGGIVTPSSIQAGHRMTLEDIYFFKDSWRLRNFRAFYPFCENRLARKGLWLCNVCLAMLHSLSGGRLGATASWLGIYGNTRCD